MDCYEGHFINTVTVEVIVSLKFNLIIIGTAVMFCITFVLIKEKYVVCGIGRQILLLLLTNTRV